MKRFTRLICLLLVIASMVGVLAACDDKTPETTTPAAVTTTTTAPSGGGNDPGTEGDTVDGTDPRAKYWVYDVVGLVVDPIDYEAIDYSDADGYRKFDMLVCQVWSQWTFPKDEGSASNPMQGAAFLRNIEIEDLLGVDFELTIVPGHSAHRAEWMTAATTALDNGCDLFCGYSRWMAIHAMDEYLENLYQYTYPDLTMPWYPLQLYQGEYSQYNCLFYVTGSCTTRTTAEGNTVFANLAMINDAGLPDPVQLAVSGKWTITELYKYTSAFRSLAIETANTADPKYGIVLENIYPFYYGMGNRYCQLNPVTGKQELACGSAQQLQNASDCVEEVMTVFDTPECSVAPGPAGWEMMNNQMGAFVVCGMLWITNTNAEAGYAALPIPKRNTDQATYLTQTTKSLTGKTSNEILHDKLILEIKRLLTQTTLDIQEISAMLNFTDQSYFTKFFKKATGETPLKFRNLTQE